MTIHASYYQNVSDATEGLVKMRTDVTADDIALGVPCLSDRCAVARALRREHGGTWFVSRHGISREDETGVIVGSYRTPDAVKDFVDAFDEGKDVKPLTFILEAV